MVSTEFAEASAEINVILEFLPDSYKEKIPEKLKDFFKDVASKDYIPNIDPYIDLDKQRLKEKTKDILALIYMNYWCTNEQKSKLKEKQKENDDEFEENLKEQYNINIFEDNEKMEKIKKQEEKLPIKVEEKHWYLDVIQCFSNILKKIFNIK